MAVAKNAFGHLVNPQMIQLAREYRGLSRSALAKLTQNRAQTIGRLESGCRAVSTETLERLCRSLDMPAAFFFQTDELHGPSVSEFCHYR